jgi:hypothetical protein
MRTLNMVRELMTRLVGLTAPPQRKPPFVCGECGRWQRCGLHRHTRAARPVQHLSLSSYGCFPNSRAHHSLVV